MCKFLINFSKFFKSIWGIHFCLISPLSNRNFGDAIAVQGFSWIHVWNFVQCSPYPNQNSGAIPIQLIFIHISTVIFTLYQKNKTLSLFQNLKKITDRDGSGKKSASLIKMTASLSPRWLRGFLIIYLFISEPG